MVNGLAVFPCAFGVSFRLDHSGREERKNQGKLLFALGLPTKNSPSLLGLAAPLTMTVKSWRSDHLFDLFVRVGGGARCKFVKPIPQPRDREITHRASRVELPQRVHLDFIWQTQWIAQGLLITVFAHFKSSFCVRE